MNIEEKMETLKTYIGSNVAPILLEGLPINFFKKATIILANCEKEELNGNYKNDNFVSPLWYRDVENKKDMANNILIISDITEISKEEQLKFYELLKYRKINVFTLPENCVIIILAKKVDSTTVSKDIYSLVAHI